jgi:hypothetical protein
MEGNGERGSEEQKEAELGGREESGWREMGREAEV